LLFGSMAIMLFAHSIGWIASGRVYIGIVTGVARGALTLLMLKIATGGDDLGLLDPWMLAAFAQLAVLSIISAAALWSAESGRLHARSS